MTTTDTLTGFLNARLGEDEAVAKDGWTVHREGCAALDSAPGPYTCDCGWPARLLRDVAAKRAILDEWEDADAHRYDLPEGVREGRDDAERMRDEAVALTLDAIVAELAAVYASHPDYQQEWKP